MEVLFNRLDNNTLYIDLEGKITFENAQEIHEQLDKLIAGHPDHKRIQLNAQKLIYISSAGLRVLLDLKKKGNNIDLVEIQPEVYDTMEITGFTQLFNIRKALRSVDISGLTMIGHGATASVYRINDEQVIKVFAPTISFDLIENEIRCTKIAFTSGVPADIPFDMVRAGDSYAIIYEFLHALSLPEYIHTYPEKKKEYIEKYVELVLSLKEISIDSDQLSSMKENYHGMINAVAEQLDKEEIRLYHELIDAVPDGKSFIHGDCHMGNIMVQNDELVLIDMASVGYGMEFFELFNVYSPYQFIAGHLPEDAVKGMLDVSKAECMEIWQAFWDIYSRGFSQEKKEYILKLCNLYASLKAVINLIMLPGLAPDSLLNQLRNDIIKEAGKETGAIWKNISL